uniref:Uncharacterized protein n=1 Tax=Trichogramma kaykai TaxID=54128 RepID=A0ABD2W8E2_9HYME
MIISLPIVMDSLPHLNSEDDFSFEFNTQMINQHFGPVVNVPMQSVNEEEEDDVQIIYDRLDSSQDLFTQSSEETEQENWMAEFIQDRPEDIEQNHLQYIQQQIEDDSSQNGTKNWMEEFIQDRPFSV